MYPSSTITSQNSTHSPLTPLITTPPSKRPNSRIQNALASKYRLSEYSNSSAPEVSRPHSYVVPPFASSLPYTLVRDFAYSSTHPMHHGPANNSDISSELSTPISESEECLSDSIILDARACWNSGSYEEELLKREQFVSPIHLENGPPWSEDEDLQSPVVVSSRHRKHRTSNSTLGTRGLSGREAGEKLTSMLGQSNEHNQTLFIDSSGDNYKQFFVGREDEVGNPGREIATYSADDTRNFDFYNAQGQRDSHFAGTLPSRSYADNTGHESSESESSSTSSTRLNQRGESRYSRDYHFTITSSDEEMHGKAVALFDFVRENENELPLIEGQVIWVSYRHGQGWLVAEDPRTRESGLVPESYVRLLKDIHGELNSNTGQVNNTLENFNQDSGIPHPEAYTQVSGNFPNGIDYALPIVSSFSTSSMDLNPYPQHLFATHSGQVPPQVTHYHGQCGGSYINTQTIIPPQDDPSGTKCRKIEADSDQFLCLTPTADLLPVAKIESSNPVQSPRRSSSVISEIQSDDVDTTRAREDVH